MNITNFLTGHGVPSWAVGIVRGAIIAGGIAACEFALKAISGVNNLSGVWLVALPLMGVGIRSVEGVLDGLKTPPTDPTHAELKASPAAANKP